MCVHLNLVEDNEPWTTISRSKSPSSSNGKGKAKVCSSNMISTAAKESDFEVNMLSYSEDEAHVLTVDPMVATIRSM